VVFAATIGSHQNRVLDAKTGVQYLILGSRCVHAGVGTILKTHQHGHFGAERQAIKFDRFFVATLEEEIRPALFERDSFG
jgi:hypothetical protein